jgi:predicted enzyme related to lactoylglutathione lyase
MKITTVMFNTAYPEKLANFWKEFLGVEENFRIGNFLWLKPAAEGQTAIGFQKAEDAPASGRRIHFDVLVEDKSAATERVKELGGTLIMENAINKIVADTEGNKFCVYVHSEGS